jgi:hypothetical protein
MDIRSAEAALEANFTPFLQKLEAERLQIVDRNYTLLAVALGFILGGGLLSYDQEIPVFLFGGIVIGVLVYLIFSDKGASAWSAKYKQELILTMVKSFFGENGVYEPNNGHHPDEFNATDLFDRIPGRYQSEDLIQGKVDKTLITFSEVNAEYKTTSSKGNTTWHSIFRGILFTADFNKHFQGRTIVKGRVFSDGNVKMENPEFSKEFSVNATDQIEARYILSPSLMEKMLLLNKQWNHSLGFSFIGSNLTIAIRSDTDFFEASIWSKVGHHTWQRDWQLIGDLINMVDELDLNTRIWTKE